MCESTRLFSELMAKLGMGRFQDMSLLESAYPVETEFIMLWSDMNGYAYYEKMHIHMHNIFIIIFMKLEVMNCRDHYEKKHNDMNVNGYALYFYYEEYTFVKDYEINA